MNKIKVVICGYYGRGNAGDEALLMSLLQMLPPSVIPIVLSANPEQTRDRYAVISYHNRSLSQIAQALRQSQVFIWGGGSLIQDVTSFASPLYYLGLMTWAQQLGLKTIAWAQGIGPLQRALIRWTTKKVLLQCHAISVRDRASSQLLETWQIPHQIAPDPVWALASASSTILENLTRPRIAIVLRPHPQLTDSLLAKIGQALARLQEQTAANLVFIPFQPLQDLAIAKKLTNYLPQNSLIVNTDDLKILKGLFREVDWVIGMRYHSLIMALSEGCPCFAINYDPKVSQLMEQINLQGWDLSQIPDNPEQICAQWLQQYAQAQPLTSAQREAIINQVQSHQQLLTQVCDSVK